MKRSGLFFAIAFGFAVLSGAQETTSTAPDGAAKAKEAAKTKDEALIKAAREAKSKRKSGTTRVITNADVKKSKGKLIERTDTGATGIEPADSSPSLQQKHDATLKEKAAAADALEVARKKVDELQKALDDLEQRYYEENDPNYRDDVIRKRFEQTKKQLEAAQQELADARDALDRLVNPPRQ